MTGTSNANSYTGSLVNFSNDKTLTVNVEDEAGDPIEKAQVYLQKSTPVILSAATQGAGSVSITVNETIPTDTPQSGWLNVWDSSEN